MEGSREEGHRRAWLLMFLVLPYCSPFYLCAPSLPSLSSWDKVICRILAEKLLYSITRTDHTFAHCHASGSYRLSNLSL